MLSENSLELCNPVWKGGWDRGRDMVAVGFAILFAGPIKNQYRGFRDRMVDGIVHNFWAGNLGGVWKVLDLTATQPLKARNTRRSTREWPG